MEKIITSVSLRNQRVSPKKARLVMSLVRGKTVVNAADILSNTNKKSASLALALLKSAVSSAKNKDFKEEELVISESIAQEGKRMKRFFIRARGRSAKYEKRMSHLKISLSRQKEKKESNGKKS